MNDNQRKWTLKITSGAVAVVIAFIGFSSPGEVVIDEQGRINGLVNEAREALQGKGFWEGQLHPNEAGAEEPAVGEPWRAKQPRCVAVESLWPGPQGGPKTQDVPRPREAHTCPESECRQGDLDVPWRLHEGRGTLVVHKEIDWELGEPARNAQFDREMRQLEAELKRDMKEFYEEYPDMMPTRAERQAEALRERADAIEMKEFDRELEIMRRKRIDELRNIKQYLEVKLK